MSILEVDVGNTAFKWRQLASNGELLAHGRCLNAEPALELTWDKGLPEHVFFASVASQEKIDSMRRLLGLPESVEFLRVETTRQLAGVVNAYDDFSSLGVDRWLAICAAYAESCLQAISAPVMVVDCGSALTLDFVDAKGRHQGGYILPGLNMMLSALAQGTSKVGLHDIAPSFSPGKETRSAVGHGVVFSVVAVIEKAVRQAREQLGKNVQVYVTGGDAHYILPHIHFDVIDKPDLVLDGISCYWQECAV